MGVIASPVWNGFLLPPAAAFVSQGFYAGSFIETSAQALFGQFTYRLTDRLSLTLGGRRVCGRIVASKAEDFCGSVGRQNGGRLLVPANPLRAPASHQIRRSGRERREAPLDEEARIGRKQAKLGSVDGGNCGDKA